MRCSIFKCSLTKCLTSKLFSFVKSPLKEWFQILLVLIPSAKDLIYIAVNEVQEDYRSQGRVSYI